ncbi:hypothetical protein [Microcoleus anatoxicus]|uniref:Uncharacterized protein n=1 Tax=Microcoleus anatoxicus PTRS2 TaxID=2705321 RepID=A0ABU8YU84_9CYAN
MGFLLLLVYCVVVLWPDLSAMAISTLWWMTPSTLSLAKVPFQRQYFSCILKEVDGDLSLGGAGL